MRKVLKVWCNFFSGDQEKRSNLVALSCKKHNNMLPRVLPLHKHQLAAFYLLTLQPPLHWANQETGALQVFTLPNQRGGSRLSSLLLRVVRLKSDKYQPEHLTSVSHFKRTTVEATFGLRVDQQPNYSYKQKLIIRCIVFTMPKIMCYLHAFRYWQYKREMSRVFFSPPEPSRNDFANVIMLLYDSTHRASLTISQISYTALKITAHITVVYLVKLSSAKRAPNRTAPSSRMSARLQPRRTC